MAVGTATFRSPAAALDVIDGLAAFLVEQGVARVRDLVGAVQLWE